MNTKTNSGGGSPKSAETPRPLQEPAGGWPRDNYTGHFGRFKRDPFTGIREPADEETRKAMEALGITSAGGEIKPSEAGAAAADTTGVA